MAILDEPVSFAEAIQALIRKGVAPELSAADLKKLSAGVKRQAFFSAGNLYGDALESLKAGVKDLLDPASEAGKKLDQGQIRLGMKALYEKLGYDPDDEEGRDLSSDGAINLAVNTNRDMAYGAGQHMQDNDPDVVDAFPAWELYRLESRVVPRGEEIVHGVQQVDNGWDERWRQACDEAGDDTAAEVFDSTDRMIALKSSGVWQALGDGAGGYDDTLGNPYPIFAFNSGMWIRNIDADECAELGLMQPGDEVKPSALDLADLFNDSFLEGGGGNYQQPLVKKKRYQVGWANTGWIGLDLDGVLAKTIPGEHQAGVIGEPIPESMLRLWGWIADGKRVKILTARASNPSEIPAVAAWLARHGLPALEITPSKDPDMVALYDDRAVAMEPDTGRVLSPELADLANEGYGCLMAIVPQEQAKTIQEWARVAITPDSLTGDGFEKEPHVTVMFGFNLDIDPYRIQAVVRGYGPVTFRLGHVARFQGQEYDVLKLDVDSLDLMALNDLIAQRMGKDLAEPDFIYNPHLTIAYVKPGTNEKLIGNTDLAGQEITITTLLYSGPNSTNRKLLYLGDTVKISNAKVNWRTHRARRFIASRDCARQSGLSLSRY